MLASENLIADKGLSIIDLDESHVDQIMLIEMSAHSHPWAVSSMQNSLKRCFNLGLHGSKGLVGFAIVSVVIDEAELLDFVIDPSHQGQGLGTAFLNTLIRRVAKKAARFYLEVRESNIAAITLYENSGFVEVGVRRNYYPTKRGKEDAILMAMELFE